MAALEEAARWAHIVIGMLAFSSLWAAALARKGGRLHRRAGTVYVWTMTLVLASAGMFTLSAFVRGDWAGGVFLVYLLTIAGTSLWMGKRTLRFKGDAVGYTRGAFLPVGVLNIVAALGAVAAGILVKQYFIAGISAIGFVIGCGMIGMHRKPPDHPRTWLREHIGGMVGAGIATHIAFASIGLRQIFPQADTSAVTLWPWLAPLVIGFVAEGIAKRRYLGRGVHRGSDHARLGDIGADAHPECLDLGLLPGTSTGDGQSRVAPGGHAQPPAPG